MQNAKVLGATARVPFTFLVFHASEVRDLHGWAAPGHRLSMRRIAVLLNGGRQVPSYFGSRLRPSGMNINSRVYPVS